MALSQAAEHTQWVQLVIFTRLTPTEQHKGIPHWGIWTAQPHHSPVQNHQGQGTRESPKLTNAFCSAMLDESCFQAPLLTLPSSNTLKDLRATGECSKSEHGITPLFSTHQHCRKQGGKHGCALWLSTQKTPSRSSRNFHSLLQQRYWCLLESNGRWLEQAGPNLQQFRTSQGIPVNNSFLKLGKIWSQYPIFSWSVSRMRNHTEHFSNFLKGHPPLGIFIWINKMKRSLYYSFPFFLPTQALYHPENR